MLVSDQRQVEAQLSGANLDPYMGMYELPASSLHVNELEWPSLSRLSIFFCNRDPYFLLCEQSLKTADSPSVSGSNRSTNR